MLFHSIFYYLSQTFLTFSPSHPPSYIIQLTPALNQNQSQLRSSSLLLCNFTQYSLAIAMGNYISCTIVGPGGKNSRKDAITVIFPGCDIRRFHEPAKAAELMFDMPKFFLVNANSLQVGERITALSADQDLEMRNVYVFFPMNRLNSAVKTADMRALLLMASKENKRVPFGSVKVSPECGQDFQMVESNENCSVPKLNLEDMEEYSRPEFRQRMSMCRSKKPMLETIVEEHFSLRFVMMMEN